MVGPISSGKSSLIASITNLKPKIGKEGASTLYPQIGTLKFIDEHKVKLMEIPGIELSPNFKHAIKVRYQHQMKGSKLALIVLDSSNKYVERYMSFFLTHIKTYCGDVHTVVVFNKKEIAIEKKMIRMTAFLDSINQEYISVSALNGDNLNELVKRIRDYTVTN